MKPVLASYRKDNVEKMKGPRKPARRLIMLMKPKLCDALYLGVSIAIWTCAGVHPSTHAHTHTHTNTAAAAAAAAAKEHTRTRTRAHMQVR